jgi:hypothetical protein
MGHAVVDGLGSSYHAFGNDDVEQRFKADGKADANANANAKNCL